MTGNKKHNRLATAALLLVAVFWGGGFIATEYALRANLSAQSIMALRFGIGALAMGLIFRKKLLPFKRKQALHGIGAGFILFGAFMAQILGQSRTSVSNAAFITATNVVMIPLILWIAMRKRPTRKVFICSILTMLGVLVLTFQPGQGSRVTVGDLLVLSCALLFALHIVYLGLVCRFDDAVHINFWQLSFSAVLSVISLLLSKEGMTMAQLQGGALPALYLGLFSTCLCYFLQTKAQQYVAPPVAGVTLSMESIFGSLFSVLLGLELFRINMLLGGLIITLCIVLLNAPDKKENPDALVRA